MKYKQTLIKYNRLQMITIEYNNYIYPDMRLDEVRSEIDNCQLSITPLHIP